MNDNVNAFAHDASTYAFRTLYDRLPYERNLSVCGNECIRLISGNVVKFFSYTEQEAKEIPNQDHHVMNLIQKQKELRQQQALAEEALQEDFEKEVLLQEA